MLDISTSIMAPRGLSNVVFEANWADSKQIQPTTGPTLSSEHGIGSYFDEDGILQTSAISEPRFGHDPETLESLGLIFENEFTSRALHNRDWTNAVWTASNATVTRDQVGLDGVANTANEIEATANGGSVSQTVTLANAERTFEVWIKAGTVTGTVTVGDGSSTQEVSASLSTTHFRRFSVTSTQANPVISVTLGNSGDTVIVDFAHLTDGPGIFFPLETAGAAVSRTRDGMTIPNGFLGSGDTGTVFIEFRDESGTNGVNPAALVDSSAAAPEYIEVQAGRTIQFDADTNFPVETANIYALMVKAKAACSWDNNVPVKSVVLDGGTVATNGNAGLVVPAEMRVFRNSAGLVGFTGSMCIARLIVYDSKFSDAQLQTLTA